MKTRLEFKGAEVRKLIDDSKKSEKRTIPYVGENKDVPVGLILVKDDGVYLLSNGVSKEVPSKSGLIAYAKGYEAPSLMRKAGASDDDAWGAQYEKIREAVGGDDFAEALEITAALDKIILPGTVFILYLTPNQISIQVRRAA